MQSRKHDLNDRLFFFRMQAHRNSAAVVFDSYRAILAQRDIDPTAKARQNLVRCVVDDLLHDMQWTLGTRVHARSLPDRLESFKTRMDSSL